MSQTPSKRRKQGREAFYYGGDPKDHDPYLHSKAWGSDMKSKDWMDGWYEAEADYEPPEEHGDRYDMSRLDQVQILGLASTALRIARTDDEDKLRELHEDLRCAVEYHILNGGLRE